MKPSTMILFVVLILVGAAVFIPSNTLTGHIIKEGTCKEMGCVELCDVGIETVPEGSTTCEDKGTVCCFTHWDTGVCDYETNCETIREYSLYQSIEQYRNTVEERPAVIDPRLGNFFFPLVVILGIIGYFMFARENPHKGRD